MSDKRQTEMERLEEARAAWLAEYRDPRDVSCPGCAAPLGTLFWISWAEQPLMDAMADAALGGVPTQGFYVLVPQDGGPLVPLKGRRRYARGQTLAPDSQTPPPAWVGLPGEVACAACGELAPIPHPRFPEQARLDTLQSAAGKGPRRWRRGA